jgi:hypothetical protein
MNNWLCLDRTILDGEGSTHLRHKSIIMATARVLESRFPAHDNRSIDIAVDLAGIPDEH